MKNVFLAFLFFISTDIIAQKMDSLVKPVTDTTVNKVEQRVERKPIDDGTNTDFRPLLELQKQNEKKQRQAALVRIAIGVGLLLILIIGLMRKRKVKKEI